MSKIGLSEEQVNTIIDLALSEDLSSGDVTSEALIPPELQGRASMLVKAEGILAGGEVARKVFLRVDPALKVELLIKDGAKIKPGEREQAKQALEATRHAINCGKYDLIVMDEVNVAAAWKLIEVDEVAKIIKEKPQHVELILTGNYADDRLIELADLVTECVKIKHPYEKGIKARAGIEY